MKKVEITPDCTIYHGDCLEILPTLEAGSVDAVVTDIPYGEVNRDSNGLRNLDKGAADDVTFGLGEFLAEVSRIAASAYLWCGTEQVSDIRRHMVAAGMTTRLCVWEKSNPSPMNGEHVWLSGLEACVYGKRAGAPFNEFCKTPCFRGPIARDQRHPTQKPIWLMQRLVLASSRDNGTICDPCCGSGTTGVACLRTGRKFIGIEIDEHYFEIARKRLESEAAQLKMFV